MKAFAAVILCLSLIANSNAYVYSRCEFARTLLNDYGFARSTLGNWVCLANYESSFNTRAKGGPNFNGSYDWGIFQVNDYYWCYDASAPTYNDCNVNCNSLIDDSITDDVACARLIYNRHGYNAWYGWINNCEGTNVESWVSDCGI